MTTFTFTYLGHYTNHGQDAEQSVRFTLTGEILKADNLNYSLGADCLSYQIKSARATVCKGDNLEAYLNLDASTAYIYADNNGTAWVMSREEYIAFCKEFVTATNESPANGGGAKLRLKSESSKMMAWLREHL